MNFFGPAVGLGFFASALAKLCWRKEFGALGWGRLWSISSAAPAAVSVAGLVVSGHDGRMLTYTLMVIATALGLWWAGRQPRRA